MCENVPDREGQSEREDLKQECEPDVLREQGGAGVAAAQRTREAGTAGRWPRPGRVARGWRSGAGTVWPLPGEGQAVRGWTAALQEIES